jgi:hypothetical protein
VSPTEPIRIVTDLGPPREPDRSRSIYLREEWQGNERLVYVESWSDIAWFSAEILRHADPRWLNVTETGEITITAMNVTLIYQATERNERTVTARLVMSLVSSAVLGSEVQL